ncbi:MAG: response regulator [Planctomycetes bacterium]|nr:response regulator [Planctomycetota bacterium]
MKKRILIVEDDQDIVEALAIRLQAAGYEVHRAFDVVLGTSAAVRVRPDLVLLDVSMPGGNGLMLAERLQNIPETAGTPVLFLTASKKTEIRDAALALGAVGFLEKPYDARELLRIVEETLEIAPAA